MSEPCQLGRDPGSSYHSIFGRVDLRWKRRPPCLGSPLTQSASCLRAHKAAAFADATDAAVQHHLVDCVINASIHNDLPSVEELGPLLPAWKSLLRSPRMVQVPPFTRWHVENQEQLYRHLRRIWDDDRPRVMIDLGCHAGHGKYVNLSDALMWLHHFSHNGSLVVAVDAFEEFALDHQHRFDDVEPCRSLRGRSGANSYLLLARYRSLPGVSKRALARAVNPRDGGQLDLYGLAKQSYACCGWRSCYGSLGGIDALERQGYYDHLCRIPRQRLNPKRYGDHSKLPLPPSSYPHGLLASIKRGQRRPRPYPVRTTRVDTLWREHAEGRRIDLIKIDVDTSWAEMGLHGLFHGRAFSVMVIEVDGYWGGVVQDYGVTPVDELLWLADQHGYEPFIKVPCRARAHVSHPPWEELSVGVTARYKRLLRRRRPHFVPTLYSATGRGGKESIQDLLLADRQLPGLVARLVELGDADCEEGTSFLERPRPPAWLPSWRATDSAPPAWVRAWVRGAQHGYCDKTTAVGSCTSSTKGSLPLLPQEAMSWEQAVHACMRRCLECAQCNFVSVSMQWQDCSWFRSCALRPGALKTDVPAFMSGPRVTREMVEGRPE